MIDIKHKKEPVRSIEQDYVPELVPSIIHKKWMNRHLLLHPDKPTAIVLNPVGMDVYRLCNGRNTIKEITEVIVSRYNQPFNRVYPDVQSFLNRLEGVDFFRSSEGIKKQTVLLPKIKTIHLNITDNCNLHCIHCGITDIPDREELPTERVIHLIDELVFLGGKAISITGGEPLLRKDCFFIIKYAASRLKTSLLTNAVAITPEIARRIVDMGIKVQVSLDGSNPEIHDAIRGKGSYQKAMRGIELLKAKGIDKHLSLRITLMRINAGDWRDILRLARKIGIKQIRIATIEKLGRAKNNWEKLILSSNDYDFLSREILESLKKAEKNEQLPQVTWGCTGLNLSPPVKGMACGLGQSITIDSSGDVFPCTLMMHPAFHLGNIRDMTLDDVSRSPALKSLYRTCLTRKETVSKCRLCTWRNFCQGGCPASVYASTGSLKLTDSLCLLRDKFYTEAFLGQNSKEVYPVRKAKVF